MYLFVVGCKIKATRRYKNVKQKDKKLNIFSGVGVLLNSLNKISDMPQKLIGKFQNGGVAL